MSIRWHRRILLAFRSFVRRRTVEQELDDELQFHAAQLEAHLAARGLDPAEAGRSTRRQFGGLNQVKEACRDIRPLRSLEYLLQDVRFGARLLVRGPVFTAVAVSSLALGIGANTAIFSLINAIVLRPLPVAQPAELYLAQIVSRDDTSAWLSYPLVEDLRDALAGRAEICGQSDIEPMQIATRGSTGATTPEAAQVQLVSGDCFTVLRQRAQAGRLLGREDSTTPGPHPVGVISDAYWSRRFGRAPAAVGSELLLNGTAVTIVGITRPEFFGTTVAARTPDVWMPAVMQPALRFAGSARNSNGDTAKPWPPQRELSWLGVVVRLPSGRPDAVVDAMNLVLQRNFAQVAGYSAEPDYRERLQATRLGLDPGARGFSAMRRDLATPLVVLLLMVGVVLVVACANMASLLLARATHRHREMAIRMSIGAGRRRLIRQLLTESLLLALLGGAVGLLMAEWGIAALGQLAAQNQPATGLDISPDARVLLFTLAISLGTGILFGLLPALRSTGVSLADALKAQARGAVGFGRQGRAPVGKLLIAGQIAFSLLLLVVAGLFARSLQQLMRVDVGFDRDHILVARIDPRGDGYDAAELPALYRRLTERITALPGVTSASLSANGPFSGSRTTSGFEVQGYAHGRDERLRTQEEVVTPDYFRTVGLTILRGRAFTAADVGAGHQVSVVNETFAKRYFAGRDPVGSRWSYGTDFGADAFEIVGVVQDARYNDVKAESPNMAYHPAAQSDTFLESVEVRSGAEPGTLVSSLRAALREAEPRLTVTAIDSLDDRIARLMVQERVLAWVTTGFGGLALLLACLGLYGTISYAVTRRTAELGVRMALGAGRGAVRQLIMREALTLVVLGLAAGVPLALLATRAMRKVFFGVAPFDVTAYGAAIAVLAGVAVLAAYLPARRASLLDPTIALRAE